MTTLSEFFDAPAAHGHKPVAAGSRPAWQAGQATLAVLRFAFGSAAAALFTCDPTSPTEPRLVTSEGLTQAALDGVRACWRTSRGSLAQGHPTGRQDPAFVIMPCTDKLGFAGLVYLEGVTVFLPSRVSSLVPMSPLLARILRRLAGREDLDEEREAQTPSTPDVAATQLQVLLERHEWNVSLVARVLGVTRMTIYNRMRRAGMPRERVKKTLPRVRPRAPR